MYLARVTTPSFIVLEDDDLPVTPKPRSGGAPRTSTRKYAASQRASNNRADAKRYGREVAVASPATVPDVIPEDTAADNDDLAAVVVKRTNRLLAAGKVTPTLRDGLAAQQLLDRRAEKAADRSFMLNLALALAGGGSRPPAALLPPGPDSSEDVIEGEFTEENLAPEHLRQG